MFCKLLKIGVLSAAFAAISGCATPTVQTNVSVSSKLSMTPDLNPGLHAMPDWGDTVAIVPSSSAKKNDATYRTIAGSLQNLLTAAHMQVVNAGSGEKYRMSVDWSLKPSRIIRRTESVPVTVYGPRPGFGMFPPPPPPPRHHRHWVGPHPIYMPQTAFVSRVYTQQLYMRELDLKLIEMKGKRQTTVFNAVVRNEAGCKTINDILPYMVKSAIDNLYSPDGTRKVVTLPQVSEVCR